MKTPKTTTKKPTAPVRNLTFPGYCTYGFHPKTSEAAWKIPAGTISEDQHKRGMRTGDPLIISMDALIKYAEAHKRRFESPLSEDYVLGPLWLESAKGIRGLLNGETLSDCGSVETMFWSAMEIAGFTEKDL
jgi:hypothetical protein